MRMLLSLLFITLIFAQEVFAEGVYGEDNRHEVVYASVSKQSQARSVAAMVPVHRYDTFVASGAFMPEIAFKTQHELCEDVRFANQPSLSDCTGFLIAPNKILTAGHCVVMEAAPCEEFVWVFDYKLDSKLKNPLANAEVAYCKNIERIKYDPAHMYDYAIIELTKNIERPILKPSKNKPKVGDKLYTIGHPNGLPQKVTDGGYILKLEKNIFGLKIFQIVHNLDLFKGNSGSPILDESSGDVVGITVSGEDDFNYEGECGTIKTYIMKPELAEVAMSITQVEELR